MNVVQQYKTWVRNNSNLLGAIEGGLSSLTWLLPDRFSDSELNLEALNSMLGLLGLFHESILQEPVYQQNGKQPSQWPLWLGAVQLVNVETRTLESNPDRTHLDTATAMAAQVEVLVEMAARNQERKGAMSLYTPLTLLEALKATLRLLILQRSGDRILTDGGLTASNEGRPAVPHTTPEMRAQAVYAAFARFRAHHVLSPSKHVDTEQASSPAQQSHAEADAVDMLRHVSNVVSQSSAVSQAPSQEAQQQIESQQPGISPLQEAASLLPSEEQTGEVSPGVATPQSSPARQLRTLSSHPLPPSPGESQSPYWWDAPDTTLWPEEDARSELESESSAGHLAEGKLRELQKEAQQQQITASRLIKAGELANICRPLIYVIALRRHGRKSWKPWMLSLAVDLLSAQLSKLGATVAEREINTDSIKPGLSTSSSMLLLFSLQSFKWTPLEQRELTRRKLLVMYYLIRSPFFDRYTRGVANTALTLLQPIPLVGLLAGKAGEILFGIQQYYTYTSAS